MKVPIALRIFLIGIVVLLVTAIPILFKNHAYAQTNNCSLNIYPQPRIGTYDYTVTFTDNTNVPFVDFRNNWYGTVSGGGIDTIGNSRTGRISSVILPAGWTYTQIITYGVEGTTTTTATQQITYEINLTLNNGFGGIDIAANSDYTQSYDLCNGHYSPFDITYNSLSPSLTPTPTPIPTATPTPTPTVVPVPTINLNVPVLRQTDKPWNTQVYDGANFWSPLSKTINSWGCALTSYSMVLKYFGINKLPNGITLDPGTLNTWLKKNNGYIDGKNSGYLNPLAISSLSHQAIKINKITAFDGLEYSRVSDSNNEPLINELVNNRPVIIEEPGHFIVATGITTNSFSINDPYYNNHADLTAYNNTFVSLNELKPAHTDLSYILITADTNTNIQIKDSNGNSVGQEFLQQPLVNADTSQPAGSPIRMALVSQPTSNNYTVVLTSQNPDNYTSNIYFYDQNGNVNTKNISINASPSQPTKLNLNYNKQHANSSTVSKIASLDSLIADIENLESNHEVNPRTADKLINSIDKIQKNYNKRFKMLIQIELRLLSESLRFYDKNLITKNAVQIITSDINDLIKDL